MLYSSFISKFNLYKKNNLFNSTVILNNTKTILGGCVPTTLTNCYVNNKNFKNIAYFSTNIEIKENKSKMPKKPYYRTLKKRKFIPIAYNNHSNFLLKYFFKQFSKGQYTFLFKPFSDTNKKKEIFLSYLRDLFWYIVRYKKVKVYKLPVMSRIFSKLRAEMHLKESPAIYPHTASNINKNLVTGKNCYAFRSQLSRYFRIRFKDGRNLVDKKYKKQIRKNNYKYKNLFWLRTSQHEKKKMLILWKKYYFAPAWRPYAYLHKKNKLFFNWGDKYLFFRFPVQRYKYPVLFYFPRFADYRRLYKNQLREQHIFRWIYRLKFSQLIKRFRKAVNGTKRIFELMFLKYFEFRLDTIVYRLNFAFSLKHARQLVNRGLFTVNNKVINNYTYHVLLGDVIMPVKRFRLMGSRLKYLNTKAKGFFLLNMRLFYRPIQADQYMDYLFINERIPAGLIIKNIDTSTLRFNRSFSIQYLTLSMLKYN